MLATAWRRVERGRGMSRRLQGAATCYPGRRRAALIAWPGSLQIPARRLQSPLTEHSTAAKRLGGEQGGLKLDRAEDDMHQTRMDPTAPRHLRNVVDYAETTKWEALRRVATRQRQRATGPPFTGQARPPARPRTRAWPASFASPRIRVQGWYLAAGTVAHWRIILTLAGIHQLPFLAARIRDSTRARSWLTKEAN